MADPQTITDLGKALASLNEEDVKELLTRFEENFRKLRISLGDLSKKATEAGTTIKEQFTGAYDEAKGSLEDLQSEIKLLQNIDFSLSKFDSFKNNLIKGFQEMYSSSIGEFAKIGAAWTGLGYSLSNLPQSKVAESFHKEATDITADSSYIKDFLGSLNIENAAIKNMIEWSNASFAAVDSVNKMETAFISIASKSGQFNMLLDQSGEKFDHLDDILLAYAEKMSDVGNATGLTAGQVSNLGLSLSKIPGSVADGKLTSSLKELVDISDGANGQLDELTAAIKLASGTGQSGAEVVEQLSRQYMILGTTGQTALEYISDISTVSKDLNLPLEMVADSTSRTTEALKFFGNTTESTLKVLGRFAPALRGMGLGPQAINEMTAAVTQNVTQMGLASRAFVSRSTGGPGGLRGGYQLELLKSQNKVDELEKLVEQSLKQQFGGKIVTLEEAAKDEGAARQLTKQVQLVTSGPTKVVDNEQQAYRLFEAMKGGLQDTKFDFGIDGLTANVDRGTAIQQSQLNALVMLNNQMERSIAIQSVKAKQISQQGVNFISEMIHPEDLGSETMMDYGAQQAVNNPVFGGEPEDIVIPDVDQRIDSFFDSVKEGWNSIKEGEFLNPILNGIGVPPAQLPSPVQTSSNQIHIDNVCPSCHQKEHKATLAMMDGKLIELEKGRSNINLTGTNLG